MHPCGSPGRPRGAGRPRRRNSNDFRRDQEMVARSSISIGCAQTRAKNRLSGIAICAVPLSEIRTADSSKDNKPDRVGVQVVPHRRFRDRCRKQLSSPNVDAYDDPAAGSITVDQDPRKCPCGESLDCRGRNAGVFRP